MHSLEGNLYKDHDAFSGRRKCCWKGPAIFEVGCTSIAKTICQPGKRDRSKGQIEETVLLGRNLEIYLNRRVTNHDICILVPLCVSPSPSIFILLSSVAAESSPYESAEGTAADVEAPRDVEVPEPGGGETSLDR